ncbi:MAG: TIGR03084 family protein [Sandaracinaceae bacterium]|nr:TIGR03084 family protein [Sandaracinaceae bacterium]
MQQADAFLEESLALHALIADRGDALAAPTQFKGWTVEDVVAHLHHLNLAVELALESEAAFATKAKPLIAQMMKGRPMLEVQRDDLGDLTGGALVDAWRETSERLADAFRGADPKQRVPWFGPSMSARTAATARHMETWAHGESVFDALGAAREETDRVRNVAHLAVQTIPYAFQVRGEAPPAPPLHVRLVAPSGAIWSWNEADGEPHLEGSAVELCRVATQTRSAADTALVARGAAAERWLRIAQCFAGPAVEPPAPGTRFRRPTVYPR